MRVVVLVLYTFATTMAEKYVFTCLYVTSASFSDGALRRDGAACLPNIYLCLLLVRCSICLLLSSTSVLLFNVLNILVYMSICAFFILCTFPAYSYKHLFRRVHKIAKSDC